MHFSLRSLGRVIAAERHVRGYTQIQLAKLAKVHRAYLSDVEQGHRNITIDVLARIADTLQVKVSQLIVNAEEAYKSELKETEEMVSPPKLLSVPTLPQG